MRHVAVLLAVLEKMAHKNYETSDVVMPRGLKKELQRKPQQPDPLKVRRPVMLDIDLDWVKPKNVPTACK